MHELELDYKIRCNLIVPQLNACREHLKLFFWDTERWFCKLSTFAKQCEIYFGTLKSLARQSIIGRGANHYWHY